MVAVVGGSSWSASRWRGGGEAAVRVRLRDQGAGARWRRRASEEACAGVQMGSLAGPGLGSFVTLYLVLWLVSECDPGLRTPRERVLGLEAGATIVGG